MESMKFARFEGDIAGLDADLISVAVHDGAQWDDNGAHAQLNAALDGLLQTVAEEEGFEGKDGQSLLLHTHGKVAATRILCVGMGSASSTDGRKLAARTTRRVRQLGLSHAAIVAPSDDASVSWLTNGALLGHYTFDKLKTKDVKASKLATVTLANASGDPSQIASAEKLANAIMTARDLVNEPPVNVTPTVMAETAERIASENNLECKIYDKKALEAKGMRLILAVSSGSVEEPRLIHLTYRPEGATDSTPSIALVGKGLTFDAGGLCLKPYGSIEDMKIDMAGGAAVLGAMAAMRAVNPGVIVHGIVPSSENMTGAAAYRPGDVIKGYSGKTVEVLNTDAEGRLILADALHYATEQGVSEIVDCATLTGAICVALGNGRAGVFSNDDDLAGEINTCAENMGELTWHMPLDMDLKKQLKSEIADMKNVGKRWGGSITAALFLHEFVGDTTWAHIDLAGPASSESVSDYIPKGGTGFGVATLVEYARRAADRLV